MRQVTITGNLGTDPKFYEGKNGKKSRAFVRVAIDKPYNRDKRDNDDEDDAGDWIGVTAFGQLAENVSDSLGKGDHVIVSGSINVRGRDVWLEDDEGELEERTVDVITLNANAMGPSLAFQTAEVERVKRSSKRGDDDVDEEEEASKPAPRARKAKRSPAKTTRKAPAKAKASASSDVGDDEF